MTDALIKGGEQGPTTLIDKSFVDSRPYQTFIEAYRNVEQALERDRVGERRYWDPFEAGERPEARFVVDACQVENGALKMRMWNTAPPMTAEEMRTYFCTIGTSHAGAAQYSSTNRDGQLGQGFRQGTLPWNTYGVVAISIDPLRTDEPGVMMWMHKTPLDGVDGPLVYKIRALPSFRDAHGDQVSDVVAPLQTVDGLDFAAMVPDEVAQHGGMIFVLLGNDIADCTHEGAPQKNERGAGICKFLNNATLDGRMATVSFATSESLAGGGKRFDVDGRIIRFDRRRIKSYDQWAQDRVTDDGRPAVIEQGEAVNPDTGVVYRWMAGPLNLKASRHDVWNGGGFIVAPYKTDVHQILPSATVADRGYAFGMLAKTASVVGLQVFLPVRTTDEQQGLYVEQSLDRSRLILASGQPIPWRDEIGRWFADNLPEPIQRLNAEVEAMTPRATYDLSRFKRRSNAYLSGISKSEANIEDPEGDVPGDPLPQPRSSAAGLAARKNAGGGSGGDDQRRRTLNRDPNGSLLGRLRQRSDLPEIKWLPADQWDEQVGEPHDYLAVYRRGVKSVLYFHADHHIVEHVADVIIAELRDETGLLPDVTYPRAYLVERIQQHITCDVLGRVSHVEKVFADDPDARENLLTPATLTAQVAGFDTTVELVKKEIQATRSLVRAS